MANILIKASGDIVDNPLFLENTIEKAKHNYVVVICGGGTRISSALKKAGYVIKYDKLGRRITKTPEERRIMSQVLEKERKRLQGIFSFRNITVISPIICVANSILCPINGDDLVKTYELGFDEVYIFTKKERIIKKRGIFKNYPKVKIIGL